MLNDFQEYENRVPATNCIFARVDILLKLFETVVLNSDHAFPIQFFDALPNLSILWLVVIEIKPSSPMTKITGKDEYRFRVVKVGGKNFTVLVSHLLIDRACANWNYFNFFAEGFDNVRQMHFNGMLIFLVVNVDHMEALLFLELVHG